MCRTPISVKTNQTYNPVKCKQGEPDRANVPCGKCPQCIKRLVSQWSFRLVQEDKYSDSSFFLTLTYDIDHVPITRAGFMSLHKRHTQLFFKKLRKAHSRNRGIRGVPIIKYFIVGEYGTKSYRPHYHAIIFNAEPELMFNHNDLLALKYSGYDGKQPVMCKQWEHGHVTVGTVSGASVGYTMKYMEKPKRIPAHRNDDRIPEFRLMSKKLGEKYITEDVVKWHNADLTERLYVTSLDGKKLSMPRYYKERLYTEYDRLLAGKAQLQKMQEKNHLLTPAEIVQDEIDNTYKVYQEFKKMYKNALKGRDSF